MCKEAEGKQWPHIQGRESRLIVKPRFKDKMLNKQYYNLLGKTPEELHNLKVFGSLYHAFKAGYDGRPKPIYIARNTFNYAAYVAGKETKKIKGNK